MSSWMSGEFQTSFEDWLGDHIGFRGTFVRIYNQLEFSLFSISHAKDVVVGRESYLFEQRYIDAHLGIDKTNDKYLDDKLRKTKFVKDTLESIGVKLLVVVAPSKGDFYPEYIPESKLKQARNTTNYQYMTEHFRENSIAYIDFNRWFLERKSSSEFPLITKCGIHWSDYGAALAADMLISHLEQALQIDMPELIIKGIRETTTPTDVDYDLGHLLNIFSSIPQGVLGYPEIEYHTGSTKTKPKIIVIGDSFYWNLRDMGLFDNVTENNDFWYYFSTSYGKTEGPLNEIDVKGKVEGQDMILLLVTAAGVNDFDMGFSNYFYDIYNRDEAAVADHEFQIKVKEMEANIRRDAVWMDKIRAKAKEKGIRLDEMIRLDAEFVVRELEEKEYAKKSMKNIY